MNDRAVQDEIIRYLADAKVRAQGPRGAPMSASGAVKAAQFAHFLARRFYRDRLVRSFRYSHRWRKQTGRIAEEVVEGAEFDPFLRGCVMGSLESAQRVGEMARAHLQAGPHPGAWWPDLLEYEYAYFLQAATTERNPRLDHPSPGVSAVCRRFAWALPEMLPRLRAAEAIGQNLRHPVSLLFSRTEAGRVYVVEVEPALERTFRAIDGQRSPEQIAQVAEVEAEQVQEGLAVLKALGAVVAQDATR
jgi:hypothetical protein